MEIKYPPPFLKRVQTRMVFLIIITIASIVMTGVASMYGFVLNETRLELSDGGNQLTRIIRQSFERDSTPRGHASEINETFEQIAIDEEVQAIWILDMGGKVKYSYARNGSLGSAQVCAECHGSKSAKPQSDYKEKRGGDLKRQNLRAFATISGAEKGCASCHSRDGKKHLGVAVIDVHIKAHDVFLANLRNYGSALAVLAVGVVFVIVSLGFNRSVTRPISEIIEGLAAVGAGDMTRPLKVRGEGELALLADAFEKMRSDLAGRDEQVKEKDSHIEELDFLRDNLESVNSSLRLLVSELSLLNNISATANATLDLDELIEKVGGVIRETLDLENISLFMFSDKSHTLELKAATGLPPEATARAQSKPGEGIAGTVFQASLPMVIEDVRNEAGFDHHAGIHPDSRSLVAIPLTVRDKNTGVLCISSRKPGVFSHDELPFYSAVANHLAIALDNARLYELQRELATKDSLTGLCNHGCFQANVNAEVSRVLRYPRPLAAMMIDIDHFKAVNDTYGHQTGDVVLAAMSRIIEDHTREVDSVGRYGGEEFSVMLPETDLEGARVVAERIRAAAEAGSFCLDVCKTEPVKITVSVGVSEFLGAGDSASELIARADKALYMAKNSGRNRVVTYTGDHPDHTETAGI